MSFSFVRHFWRFTLTPVRVSDVYGSEANDANQRRAAAAAAPVIGAIDRNYWLGEDRVMLRLCSKRSI